MAQDDFLVKLFISFFITLFIFISALIGLPVIQFLNSLDYYIKGTIIIFLILWVLIFFGLYLWDWELGWKLTRQKKE